MDVYESCQFGSFPHIPRRLVNGDVKQRVSSPRTLRLTFRSQALSKPGVFHRRDASFVKSI